MNNVDRGLVIILTLSIITVGFVLENKLLLMHKDLLSMHSSKPEPSSSKYKGSARLQRVEKALNIILTQRNYSSYFNLTDIVDVLVSKLAKFNMIDTTSEKAACGLPNDKVPFIDEDLGDVENQEADTSETLDGWTVIPWLCWLGVWIYRLFLAFVLGFGGSNALQSHFKQKWGKGFCQVTVFIGVSCVGYFPNVLMDVCGSHCAAWYFRLCIGISRILWIMSVCFVNTRINKRTPYKVGYMVISIISIIVMYNGFNPMMIMT